MNIVSLLGRALLAATLVVLFFAPLTMITSLLWLAGLVIFAKAIFALVRELRGARAASAIAIATVTIVLFPVACANLGNAIVAVDREAGKLAKMVQATCAKDRRCPEHKKVCSVIDDGNTCRMGGSLGIRYPIHYRLDDALKRSTFVVSYSKGMDDSSSFRGGVWVPLTQQHLMDGVAVSPSTDAGTSDPLR